MTKVRVEVEACDGAPVVSQCGDICHVHVCVSVMTFLGLEYCKTVAFPEVRATTKSNKLFY